MDETEDQQSKRKLRFDARIKAHNIHVGDMVLLHDSCYLKFPGKLRSRWGGPYLMDHIWENGSLQLKTFDGDQLITRVNGSCVKRYYPSPNCGMVTLCPPFASMQMFEGGTRRYS